MHLCFTVLRNSDNSLLNLLLWTQNSEGEKKVKIPRCKQKSKNTIQKCKMNPPMIWLFYNLQLLDFKYCWEKKKSKNVWKCWEEKSEFSDINSQLSRKSQIFQFLFKREKKIFVRCKPRIVIKEVRKVRCKLTVMRLEFEIARYKLAVVRKMSEL